MRCIVMSCDSTKDKYPEKIFFRVPGTWRDAKTEIRQQWLDIARYPKKNSVTTKLYCCQDHFNLQDDTVNYMMYKMGSTNSLRLKQSVVPHINLPDAIGAEPVIQPELLIIEPEPERVKSSNEIVKSKGNKTIRSTIDRIQDNPKNEIGVPSSHLWMIKLLSNYTERFVNDIYLTLMKLRQNDDFYRLGYFFGVSDSSARGIFETQLPEISRYFGKLLLREGFTRSVPIAFRSSFNRVGVIVDFFEVDVRYSGDRRKFLISCTTDGLISYVSDGFCNVEEVEILRQSDFLSTLPKRCVVMTRCRVRSVEDLLRRYDCVLTTPSDIDELSDKKKRNAVALRSCVERTVEKLSEFKFISDVVDLKDVDRLNDAVKVAAGLINLDVTNDFCYQNKTL